MGAPGRLAALEILEGYWRVRRKPLNAETAKIAALTWLISEMSSS